MPGGFLPTSVINSYQAPRSAACRTCGLWTQCKSPKMLPTGEGKREILIVAESPGTSEDKHNTQLIGNAGQFLRKTLRLFDVDLDRDCWKTNAVICFPKGTPTERQVYYCFPNLKRTIEKYKPKTIIVLGGTAVESLIGWLWKSKPGGITRWVGWQIPSQQVNAWICPTYHPSYFLHSPDAVLEAAFQDHLEDAISLDGTPWDEVPDYTKQVEVIEDGAEAATIIRKITDRSGRASFDLETNMLKPDSKEAAIVCCSICWEGKKTIAFPWLPEVYDAMAEFLQSSVKKIAANLKFEHRWIKALLDIEVRNWYWDTMQAAHLLDNRRGVSGLKFQAFAELGQPSYDEHIVPYFKSENSNSPNRINELDLRDLLLYCGMDSLLEFKLAEKQMKKMGAL